MISYHTILNVSGFFDEEDQGILLLLLNRGVAMPIRRIGGWACRHCSFTNEELVAVAEHILDNHSEKNRETNTLAPYCH